MKAIALLFIAMSPLCAEFSEECCTAKLTAEPSGQLDPQAQPVKINWNPKIGMRVGITNEYDFNSGVMAFFLENQLNRHFAIRPGLEFIGYRESDYYWDDDWGQSRYGGTAKISHVGAVADCLFYFRGQRPIARGIYLLAGLGFHRTKLEDEYDPQVAESHIVPTIAFGIGWTWKYVGYEIKGTRSALKSIYYQDVGSEWLQIILNFRFNLPGRQQNASKMLGGNRQ